MKSRYLVLLAYLLLAWRLVLSSMTVVARILHKSAGDAIDKMPNVMFPGVRPQAIDADQSWLPWATRTEIPRVLCRLFHGFSLVLVTHSCA
jgi:hypothetical protein